MTRTKGGWTLPSAPPVDTNTWGPVVRIGRTIPFGYLQSEEDPDILLPVQEELDLLLLAKKHLKQYSLREVAEWLSEQSGRYISHEGLRKRVNLEKKRKRDAQNAEFYAQRAKEAAEKAQTIQSRVGGSPPETSGANP